jgi:hypothetical protein
MGIRGGAIEALVVQGFVDERFADPKDITS